MNTIGRRTLLAFPALLSSISCKKPVGLTAEGARIAPESIAGAGLIDRSLEYELSYCIELEGGGRFRRVADDYSFQSGDRFRLVVRPQFDAYVYLYSRGPGQANYSLLFPDFRNDVTNPVAKRGEAILPGPATWFSMDNRRGLEAVAMVASNRMLPEFNTTEKSIGRDDFEERVAKIQRQYRPASSRRFLDKEWVRLLAARPGGDKLAIVERLPLLHE